MARRVWAIQLEPRSILCDFTTCYLGGPLSGGP